MAKAKVSNTNGRVLELQPKAHKRIYPWAELKPGDMFFVPDISDKTGGGVRHSIRRAKASRYKGQDFMAIRTEQKGVLGTSVWRIK